ncbi:MAG TPA: cupin domain-containing protein [Gemmatimonadaceae bacterium]|nr:cupin domain-containing protein [Gemmatimonadaceae bacterium]
MRYDRLLIAAAISFAASRVTAQTPGKFAAAPPPSPRPAPAARPVRAEALPSKVDYIPQGRYDELRNFVVRSRTTGGTLFNSPDGQTNYMMVLRSAASDPEEHSRWDDLIIVRAGSGTIEMGPKTTGARFLSAGELRGGTIMSPSRLELRPGDIARIPAGIPHAFTPNGPEPWEFLLVKIRRPSKPLKRPPPDAR